MPALLGGGRSISSALPPYRRLSDGWVGWRSVRTSTVNKPQRCPEWDTASVWPARSLLLLQTVELHKGERAEAFETGGRNKFSVKKWKEGEERRVRREERYQVKAWRVPDKFSRERICAPRVPCSPQLNILLISHVKKTSTTVSCVRLCYIL